MSFKKSLKINGLLCALRYLLKLRTEVDIMQQLGYSLDAVNLKVRAAVP